MTLEHRGPDPIPARRLTDGQRARLTATDSKQEDDTAHAGTRLGHIRQALAEAVEAGRLTSPDANGILARLAGGEDPHAVRRELRAAGVLVRQDPRGKKRNGEARD